MFERLINYIQTDKYNNFKDGVIEINLYYKRGLITEIERDDLIACLQWHIRVEKPHNNNYIGIY